MRLPECQKQLHLLARVLPGGRQFSGEFEASGEIPHRFGVSRTQQRFAPSLPQISDGLVPNLTLDSVMGAPLDLGAQGIWGEPLERLEDSPVQLATSILRKAFIRDLVGERVLEGVLEVWRDSRLVKKLHRLKLVEAAPQGIVALIGHRAQQRELNFLAN